MTKKNYVHIKKINRIGKKITTNLAKKFNNDILIKYMRKKVCKISDKEKENIKKQTK